MNGNLSSAKKLFGELQARLREFMPEPEVSPHTYWIMEALFGVNRMDVVMDKPLEEFSAVTQSRLEEVMMRLQKHEPIQYILGEAAFFGRMLQVGPAALIPRPETEELVQLIIIRHGKERALKVLDVGTGSGCIGVTLALELAEAKVTATDISEDALIVARSNASSLGATLDFICSDILQELPDLSPQNIIVSNPPYIRTLEAPKMAANVLDWEPHLALFIEDHDPLLFYRRISAMATTGLVRGGHLYFEINEAFGGEVVKLLEEQGFSAVKLHQDMQGKDRMVSAEWLKKSAE